MCDTMTLGIDEAWTFISLENHCEITVMDEKSRNYLFDKFITVPALKPYKIEKIGKDKIHITPNKKSKMKFLKKVLQASHKIAHKMGGR